jgi:choline dehydrogenase
MIFNTNSDVEPSFDYVIVGAGAGGGPLAANLARAGRRVLLMDAGDRYQGLDYEVPAFHGRATENDRLRWDYFVRHYANDQRQALDPKYVASEGGVLYPRAGTVGGCSAHNAMITVYPHAADWDGIAAVTGDDTWRSDNMRGYFERLENCRYVRRPWRYPKASALAAVLRRLPVVRELFANPSRHGFDGWLRTSLPDPRLVLRDHALIDLIIDAATVTLSEDLGRALTDRESLGNFVDPNDWRVGQAHSEGLWLIPLATDSGRRNGTREYVDAVAEQYPGRLVVLPHALATKVIFDSENRAVGLEYLGGDHLYEADPEARGADQRQSEVRRVVVDREVILAAGAFNTPQLLKLSGIGPHEELTSLGIDVRVDLPGVGENLQDRYEVGVMTEMESEFSLLKNCTFRPPQAGAPADPGFVEWLRGEGVYTTNGAVVGIIRKSRPDLAVPDVFLFGLPAAFHGYFPGYSEELEEYKDIFTWAILKAHTRNTAGSVTLRSADPTVRPSVNFRYFDEGNDSRGEDLAAVVDAIIFARRLMSRAGRITRRELLPGDAVATPAQLAEFVKNQAWGHHASCTCKIGTQEDPYAVVDSNFRVHGVQGLRVVDASVFPRIPGFFIATAIYMLSEKATDAILADEGTAPAAPPRTRSKVSLHT